MPRYTQVTPTFTPVDYATRIAPLEQYKDEYDKRLDKIEEQGLLADAIGGLIDENTDPELMQVYNDYSTKMQNTAKNLLDSGDLRSSRQSLLELRRDYANKLLPIQQAFNNRAEAAKSFREQKAKDPTYIGTDPLEHGLKDYMNGRMPNDKVASGAALYTLGQKASSAASGREIRETAWALDRKLGNQFFTKIKQEGWSQDEAMYALENLAKSDDKSISEDARKLIGFINDTVSNIHSINDIDSFSDKKNRDASDGWILRGVIDGIGYKQEEKQQKYDATMWLDKQIKEEQLKNLRRENSGDNGDTNYRTSPRTYTGSKSDESGIFKSALSPYTSPVTNYMTGHTANDRFEAYSIISQNKQNVKDIENQLRNLEKEYNIRRGDVGFSVEYGNTVQMYGKDATRWLNTPSDKNQEEAGEKYIQLQRQLSQAKSTEAADAATFGGMSLTDKEYNKIKELVGKDGNLTKSDIIRHYVNNPEYVRDLSYHTHQIANKGFSETTMDDLSSTLANNIAYFKDTGKKEFGIRDVNGNLLDKKDAEKVLEKLNKDNITSIDISMFSGLNGCLEVTIGSDKKVYQVPDYLFGDQSGDDVITSRHKVWNGQKYEEIPSLQEVIQTALYSGIDLTEAGNVLDKQLHVAAQKIQDNSNKNFTQTQSKTKSSR